MAKVQPYRPTGGVEKSLQQLQKRIKSGETHYTESINILGILELGSIFWMTLGSLEYLRPKLAPKHGLKWFTFRDI